MFKWDAWFTNQLEDDDKLRWFQAKPFELQREEFFTACQKRAKKLAGQDIYKIDPIMGEYTNQGRSARAGFSVRNNCASWATGNTRGERMVLNQKILCPQLGDGTGVPFVILDGKPESAFAHLARTRRLCLIDGLEPVKVSATQPLPSQTANQRLIGIALFRQESGEFDTHCVVRAPGSTYFSHKYGTVLPPSMLDCNGSLISDPRKAQLGERVSRWMFFTAPAAGLNYGADAQTHEQVRAVFAATTTPHDKQTLLASLAERVAVHSPRMAQHLLKRD